MSERHEGAARAIAISADGQIVLTVGNDGLRRVIGDDGRLIEPRARGAVGILGHQAYVGLEGETATVGLGAVDLERGGVRELETNFEEEGLLSLDVSRELIAIGGDDLVEVLRPDGTRVGQMRIDKWAYVVRFSPSGRRLFVGSWSGFAWVCDVAKLPRDGESLGEDNALELLPTGGPVMDAAFLDEDRVIVVGPESGGGGMLRLWDLQDGSVDKSKTDHGLHAVTVLPGGRAFAVAGNGGRLYAVAVPARGQKLPLVRWETPLGGGPAKTGDFGFVRTYYKADSPMTVHGIATGKEKFALALECGEVGWVPVAPVVAGAEAAAADSEKVLAKISAAAREMMKKLD